MEKKRKKRGLGSMSPEQIERITSLGGKAVSANRAHMQEIGRKGGLKSGIVKRMNKDQK